MQALSVIEQLKHKNIYFFYLGLFLHKSQYMSTYKLCVSIDVHFFGCEFSSVKSEKLANTLSNIHTGTDLIL